MELIVRPKQDVMLRPAMQRMSVRVKNSLVSYKLKKITTANLESQLEAILYPALLLSAERGYHLAIKTNKTDHNNTVISWLQRKARDRAHIAAHLITDTTKNALSVHAAMSKKQVASKDRSDGIVEYEMPRLMFLGMRKGWDQISGTRRPTKRWLTSSDNPCELCLGNEDDGPIPLNQMFSSGDFEPPGHPRNCECYLGLYI